MDFRWQWKSSIYTPEFEDTTGTCCLATKYFPELHGYTGICDKGSIWIHMHLP